MKKRNTVFNFNADWKFIKEDVNQAFQPAFDDDSWEVVSAPHTFNDIDTFDDYMEGGHNGERNMFTGRTWYRKHFTLDEKDAGKKVFIEFEGIRQAADVYINGHKLEGKYENGFIPFGYDLSPYLHFGPQQENVIAVMADNTFPYKAEGTDDVLSWHDSHWHPTHGGIYRNVYLHIKDKLHITLPLYSFLHTQGTYVYATDIEKDSAVIHVETEVQNDYPNAKNAHIVIDVLDQEERIVLTMDKAEAVEAGKKTVIKTSARLTNIHRWSPSFPYVYTVRTSIQEKDRLIDMEEVPLGIRTFEFTNDQGFFINGNHEKLTGWGQRPTNEWAGLGAAYPNWMHGHIFELMKNAGGNFIRWGHSAGAPADVEIADHYGLITVQPGVDGEGSTVGGVYSNTAYEIRANAFRDMIIYYRNHPSILLWESGNQSMPEKEAETLKALKEKWDPHGARVFANRRSNLTMNKFIDVSIGTEGSWELKSKGQPVIEGEYNREEAARRVWDRYTPGYENYQTSEDSAYNLTSEDLAKNQAFHYTKISDPKHSGGANWIFSDSTSHGRVHSEVARVSGQVDGVMLPKEAYYTTKAIFRKDPQLHIIGHWNYPENTVKSIYIMSNADQVELFINGDSKGFGSKSDTYLFTFEEVKWEKGTIKAVGYDKNQVKIIEQQKETTGEAYAVKLTPLTGPAGFQATGSDILLVDAEVVDENGRRVPTFEGRIDFTYDGPVIWRGGYNSGKEKSTNHTYLDIEAGINRVAIRSTLTPGTVKVTGEINDLHSDTITVDIKEVPIENGLSKELPAFKRLKLGEEPALGEGPLEKPAHEDTDEGNAHLITDFSYSGIHETGGIKTNLNIGDQIYADEEYEFHLHLAPYLLGSEYIQLPNKDTNYKALDLIHFSFEQDTSLFVAHDDRLERPEWLLEDFQETKDTVLVNESKHTIYKRHAEAGTTLTLGGNQDETSVTDSNMYIVFAKKA